MNRKAMIREYKETARPMGVYRVRNTRTDKSLVGLSVDLPAILNRHLAQLRLNAHSNRALQTDWNDVGPDAFAFEILDTLEPKNDPTYQPADDLQALLDLWLEKLSPFGERGYNPIPKRIR